MVGRQQRNLPALILQVAGKTKSLPGEYLGIHRDVILRSALRKEKPVHFPMAEFNPNFSFCGKPVIRANRFALRGSPQPASNEFAISRVSIQKLRVPIEISRRLGVVADGA